MEKKSCPECGEMFVPLTGGGLRAHGPVNARCAQDPANRMGTRACAGCDKAFILTDANEIPAHESAPGVMCSQAAEEFTSVPLPSIKGPWFGANYAGECSGCGDGIYEGDRIRSDGRGRYEGECCEHVDDELLPVSGPAVQELCGIEPVAAPEEDEFADPTTPQPKLNVSGQPEAPRDYLGRYAIRDAGTGEFRFFKNGNVQGITRVTTFNKAASDSKAINDWNRRNIVIGAALRGDLVIKARGLTHDAHREELDRLANEFETAAGSKVASSIGTDVHEITERIDAGVLWVEDAPVQYRDQLRLYETVLQEAGFEPVPGMIERVTMVTEYGGVAGTFDRVYYHRPSGTYVVGDVKTGKSMKLAMDETQCQEWLYAHGINQNGVYDINTKQWCPPGSYGDSEVTGPWQVPTVREDVGLIIHMPVQGPDAGKVILLKTDLVAGKAYAELCGSVRDWSKGKVVPWTWEPEAAVEAPQEPVAERAWYLEFAAVTNSEEARQLWYEMTAAHPDATQDFLDTMAEIGRAALEVASVDRG